MSFHTEKLRYYICDVHKIERKYIALAQDDSEGCIHGTWREALSYGWKRVNGKHVCDECIEEYGFKKIRELIKEFNARRE